MLNLLKMFTLMKNNKKGQGMVEYGLIIGLVALVVIGALVALGGGLGDIFNEITDGLDGVVGS